MLAYRHWEDGKQWLRIIQDDGYAYDEPITGWVEILNLIDGSLSYIKDTLIIKGI